MLVLLGIGFLAGIITAISPCVLLSCRSCSQVPRPADDGVRTRSSRGSPSASPSSRSSPPGSWISSACRKTSCATSRSASSSFLPHRDRGSRRSSSVLFFASAGCGPTATSGADSSSAPVSDSCSFRAGAGARRHRCERGEPRLRRANRRIDDRLRNGHRGSNAPDRPGRRRQAAERTKAFRTHAREVRAALGIIIAAGALAVPSTSIREHRRRSTTTRDGSRDKVERSAAAKRASHGRRPKQRTCLAAEANASTTRPRAGFARIAEAEHAGGAR